MILQIGFKIEIQAHKAGEDGEILPRDQEIETSSQARQEGEKETRQKSPKEGGEGIRRKIEKRKEGVIGIHLKGH